MSLVVAEATPGLPQQAGRKIEKIIKRNEKSIPIPNSEDEHMEKNTRAWPTAGRKEHVTRQSNEHSHGETTTSTLSARRRGVVLAGATSQWPTRSTWSCVRHETRGSARARDRCSREATLESTT